MVNTVNRWIERNNTVGRVEYAKWRKEREGRRMFTDVLEARRSVTMHRRASWLCYIACDVCKMALTREHMYFTESTGAPIKFKNNHSPDM